MKKLLFILLASFAVVSCTAQSSDAYSVLDYTKYEQAINSGKPVIIDVRTPDEYSSGYIKDAININVYDANFKAEVAKLNKDEPIYIYCRSGARSRQAGKVMEDLGFKTIYDLKGGIMSWRGKLSK